MTKRRRSKRKSAWLTGLVLTLVISLGVYTAHRLSVGAAGTPAADTFTRSVSSGWGSADEGGTWTTTGTGTSTSADFNVDGSAATASVTSANQNKTALLNSVNATDLDTTVKVKVDKVATGSTEVMYLLGRRVSSGNEYRGRMLFNTNNTVVIQATALVGSTETTLGTPITVSGLTYSADSYIHFRFALSGTNPTTLTMKAWADGDAEPGSWQYTTTDSSSVLQAAGTAGLQARLSNTVSNAPVLFTFDDYVLTDNDPSPSPTPTPSPSPSPDTTGADTFTRSVSSGWGSADTGGAYSVTPAGSGFNVTGTEGTMNLPAGSSYYAMLDSLSMLEPDLKVKVKIDKVATAATNSDAGVSLIARRLGSDEYRGRLKFTTSGTTTIIATKLIGGVETNLGSTTTVPGLTPTADTFVWLRFQVLNTNPTTLRMKAWADGGSEPGGWLYSTTDSESLLQSTGTVGIRSSLPSAVNNAPILFTYDSFTADASTPDPSPSPVPTYNLTGKVYSDLDGNGVQDIGEMGYENATVTVNGVGTDTTDASGDYSFTAINSATYTVTVTLPSGYVNTTSNPVSVALTADTAANFGIQSATTSVIAADTFARTVTDDWGTADTGGAYTHLGAAADFSVNGSEGLINMSGTGSVNQRTMRLDTPRATHIDYTIKVKWDKLPDTVTNNYIYIISRHVSSGNEYRGHLRFDSLGQVYLRASKIVGSSETLIGTEVRASGVTYVPGTWLNIHTQLVGTDPTTLRLNAWPDDGTAEPGTWQFVTTDAATILQQAGSIGVLTRLGTVTNTPVQVGFDDLNVVSSSIITPSPIPSPTPTPPPTVPFDFEANIEKVYTIMMENQNWSNIIGNTTSAPYINSLLTGFKADNSYNPYHGQVAYANNYRSVLAGETAGGYLHPSLPNYIWMEAGTNAFADTTFISDINPGTQSTTSTDHISNQLRLAGKEWRAYQERKPAGCPIGNATLFTPRHSPFVYFQDVSSTNAPGGVGPPSSSSTYCSDREFDFTALATHLGPGGIGTADYNFITPDQCNNMHDSGCAGGEDKVLNGDRWLEDNLPTILESDEYQAGNAVVFIIFDEDAGSSSNNPIGMMAISPKTKGGGYANTRDYSHSSYVKTIQEIFGLTPLLGHAADVGTQDFSDLFGDPVIAAAGDIACGAGSGGASCQQSATADLLAEINPSAVLLLGDNQYEQGALVDYQNYYDPTWGVFKGLTLPSVGNHEYLTSGAAGHFDYFNGVGVTDGRAGDRTKGYFSFDLGNWHLIALNTNCGPAGGCSAGSPQETWLRADLAANPNKCLLAYAHHPMFTSGQQPLNPGVVPLFQALYDYHADVFLAGHDHNYERFYPSDPAGLNDPFGITEFVVGTGGRNHTQLSSNGLAPNSAVFDATTFGVFKMVLHESSYDYEFLPSESGGIFTNGTFTETGSGTCNYLNFNATPTPSPTPSPSPAETYTVTGYVYVDTNSNGVQDQAEVAYEGAAVSLTGAGTGSGVSDANGIFTFANLGAGTYNVSVTLPSGYQATTNDPQTIALSGDTSINFGIVQSSTSFQPTAPYYSTFFYNWYKNPTVDGANQWAIWKDSDAGGVHNPPDNWFSNYLPDAGLYSSNDYTTFKYQMGKLAEAKQEVAIASWWGQGDRSDIAFEHDITDYMNRPDNPYPNLRWSLYYECEGGTCNSTLNPSVSQLTSDLNYIYTHYANEPGYLKVDGKPVLFVYADPSDAGTTDTTCSDSSMTARWSKANSQAIGQFYLVLKVFAGYTSSECQPDSWHQYAPAVRSDQQGSYAYMVSPGFWLSGDVVRLPRDLSAFTTAIQNMVNASVTWKLTETWNEWGEGSSVEPGTQVIQAYDAAAAVTDPNGVGFGNSFVAALSSYLPPLENGTGGTASPTPSPSTSTSPFTIDGTIFIDTDDDGVYDGGELGFASAAVNLSGAQSAGTATNSLGVYSFTGLNTGTYTVTLSVPSGYLVTSTNPLTTHITGDTTVNIGIKIAPSPSPTPSSNIALSSIVITPSSTSATITWNTNVLGVTEIDYGTTTLYDVHKAANIDGVTSHSITTNTLVPCTTYHLRVKSLDLDSTSQSVSSDQAFTTTGCPGSDSVISSAAALIPFDVGGSIDNRTEPNNDGLRLTIPSGYDTQSSVFQSHQLPGSVVAGLNAPGNYRVIGNYAYQLSALTSATTTVDTFDAPITLNITYTGTTLGGHDPGTLTIAHYDNGSWSTLPGCTINTGLRQVTCTTTSFSLFALVSIQPSASGTSGSSSTPGVTSCEAEKPGRPALFQVDATATTATLYITPPGRPYSSFFIAYGDGNLDEGYGVEFNQDYTGGAVTYKVNALSPNTRYTFKVRAGNNCTPGDWSGTISIKTPQNSKLTQRFYPSRAGTTTVSGTTPALYTYTGTKEAVGADAPVASPKSKIPFLPQIQEFFTPRVEEVGASQGGSWLSNLFNGVKEYVKKLFFIR